MLHCARWLRQRQSRCDEMWISTLTASILAFGHIRHGGKLDLLRRDVIKPVLFDIIKMMVVVRVRIEHTMFIMHCHLPEEPHP